MYKKTTTLMCSILVSPSSFPSNQITTQLLLTLNRLKERLEVSGAKAGEVVSLNDLNEDSRAIHQVLSPKVSPLYLIHFVH